MSTVHKHVDRYLVRGFGEDQPQRSADTLPGAIDALWDLGGVVKDADQFLARLLLRWMSIQNGEALRVWSEFSDGSRLSLDPEEVMDTLTSNHKRASFEASILKPVNLWSPIIYRVRAPKPDGVDAIKECANIRDAYRHIADTLGYDGPLDSKFTWGMMRMDLDRNEVALSAVLQDSAAALPLSLHRADKALDSTAAEIELENEIRKQFMQDAARTS
jgi:hypothetical protein